MTNEEKISVLRARQQLLEKRGYFNQHIIAKIERKIRALESKESEE